MAHRTESHSPYGVAPAHPPYGGVLAEPVYKDSTNEVSASPAIVPHSRKQHAGIHPTARPFGSPNLWRYSRSLESNAFINPAANDYCGAR
jgi:hypothetical protein